MKVPVDWLRDHIEVPDEPEALSRFCDSLTMAGLEVEEILDGPTLFTKVTPNRGDWASVRGTAREAAAVDPALSMKALDAPALAVAPEADHPVAVRIDDADGCPRYAGLVIRGVKIGPAPEWIGERLRLALGDKYRPVNNIVDITNYVCLELGQPLHAFDLATLDGGIVVRRAQVGEVLRTLDGIERNLGPGILCICDASTPIAVAGIMGGADTEVGSETTDILLESAHFDPVVIRKGSKALGLASEASYRFERYVDPELVPVAAARAAALILECAGGTIDRGLVDVYPSPRRPRRILARVDRMRGLLGVDFERDSAIAALERLGISVERSAGAFDCLAPSWRPDLTIEEDIAEEIGRIALGYEGLPETLPAVTSGRGSDTPRGRFAAKVRSALVGAGLQEVVGHSLTAPETAWTPDEESTRIAIRNPMAPQYSSLRTSLLPGLATVLGRAASSGWKDALLFEIGPVYRRVAGGSPTEPDRIAGLMAGSAVAGQWGIRPDTLAVDFYYAKGVVEELLAVLGISDVDWEPGSHPLAHPYRCAALLVGGHPAGHVAELSSSASMPSRDPDSGQPIDLAPDLPRRTCCFDLDAEVLSEAAGSRIGGYRRISRFPSTSRDIAPVFPIDVPWSRIESAARVAAGEHLETLRLVDRFAGEAIGPGRHALTIRMVWRHPDRTLRNDEVEEVVQAVRRALQDVGGELRA